jgi:hypothetical protein
MDNRIAIFVFFITKPEYWNNGILEYCLYL